MAAPWRSCSPYVAGLIIFSPGNHGTRIYCARAVVGGSGVIISAAVDLADRRLAGNIFSMARALMASVARAMARTMRGVGNAINKY